MAAIDKMYVHSYYDFNMFRKWALVYYPEIIFYMYDFDLTYEEFRKNKAQWLSNTKAIIKRDYARLGKFEHPEDAVINLIEYYKKTADYDCPKEQATEEVEYCLEQYNKMINGTLEDDYSFPVMNTPFDVDKYLKWHCPVPCVREYLHNQCGVNPKWEWFYKLWWHGKKHF